MNITLARSIQRLMLAIGLLLGIDKSALAEDTVETLNLKQAALTDQLNFAEKVSGVYGRYIVIRDSYMQGSTGVASQYVVLHSELDKWYKKWPTFIGRLSVNTEAEIQANLTGSVTQPSLESEFSSRVSELETFTVKYRQILQRSREGYSLVQALPRISLSDLTNQQDPVTDQVQLIQKKNLGPYLDKLNRNMDVLQSLFAEANQSMQRDLLDRLQRFKNDVHTIMEIKATLYSLEFPGLEAEIAKFESILATDQALEPIVTKNTQLFQSISNAILAANFLDAEQGIREMRKSLDIDYVIFLRDPSFDKERINSIKTLTNLQLKDLESRLGATFAAKGGRREALAEFILKYSPTAAAYCNEGGRYRARRHNLDCNLFKKNVAPFISILQSGKHSDKLGEGQLEVIVTSMKNVFAGPFSKEKTL